MNATSILSSSLMCGTSCVTYSDQFLHLFPNGLIPMQKTLASPLFLILCFIILQFCFFLRIKPPEKSVCPPTIQVILLVTTLVGQLALVELEMIVSLDTLVLAFCTLKFLCSQLSGRIPSHFWEKHDKRKLSLH